LIVPQTFKENPFFSDKVLTKEFKHNPPKVEDPAQNKPNEHGITDAMLEFDSDLHLDPSVGIMLGK
jgi:template-activating factor I